MLVSPWYIRNYLVTGNPIWPFAYSVFRGIFRDEVLASESISLHVSQPGGKSMLSYFTLLWNITMHSSNYFMQLGFGPLFLAFIPLIVFMKKIKKITIYLLVYSLIFITIWFFGAQVLRYLMVYPVLSIISGIVMVSLLDVKSLRKLVIFLLILSLSFNLLLWYGANSKKLPYVFGLESEKGFYLKLSDHNGYNVFDYINKNLPKNSKLLLFREVRGYLSDRDFIIAPEKAQKVINYDLIKNSDELYKRLKELKITHILINTKVELFQADFKFSKAPPYFSRRVVNLMDEVLNENSELIFEHNGVFLYSLK